MATQVTTGSTVAAFVLEALIGEGATGRVYRASNADHGKVALKVLAPELARDERFRARFLRESRLAAGLAHPHIVPVLATGEQNESLYIAMRLVEGPDLRETLRRTSPLEPESALEIVGKVADALDAAHRAGLVHRDVKPANVLLEGDRVYLCDFGLARHMASVSTLTTEGGFVGTIDYIAPEQIQGLKVDRRADVYSLACVLFECLTGERPFVRESDLATVFAHLNEEPPRVSEIRSELPQELDPVFTTALAKAPEERFGSCGELVEAARAGLAGRTFARKRRHRGRLLVGGSLALAAAATVAAVLATHSGSPSRHSAAAPQGQPKITQTTIDGVTLGRPASFYKRALGGYQPFALTQPAPHFPALAFQEPAVAVYFRKRVGKAFVITTWNRSFRTTAGIGPCSTLGRMHAVYGSRVVPTWSGTTNGGKRHGSWQLGRNLLFMTDDERTISSVVLFRGPAHPARRQPEGSPQTWANYIGAIGTACK
jgi:tRNA A-37 threonylcarbamoyl transferase component Bud32